MHQIFQDASQRCLIATSTEAEGVFYPQLPNISRRASPRTRHESIAIRDPSDRRCKSPCRSTSSTLAVPRPDPQTTLPASERGSGSWSDDSGYLIADADADACRNDVGVALPLSNQRIEDWLLTVKDAGNGDATMQSVIKDHVQRFADVDGRDYIPTSKCESPSTSAAHSNSCSAAKTCEDPLSLPTITRLTDHVPRSLNNVPTTPKHTRTSPTPDFNDVNEHDDQDGIVPLTPLSPNVCIQRGPSRHHNHYCHHASSPSPSQSLSPSFSPFPFPSPRLAAPLVGPRHPFASRAAARFKENGEGLGLGLGLGVGGVGGGKRLGEGGL